MLVLLVGPGLLDFGLLLLFRSASVGMSLPTDARFNTGSTCYLPPKKLLPRQAKYSLGNDIQLHL